ncbi:MAG: class I SAM-dependent methyltransferase [Candidatus Hydrogenedentota bacterium]
MNNKENNLMLKNEYKIMYDAENTHWWYIGLRYWLKKVLSKFINKNSIILDAGCGTGANMYLCKSLSYDLYGVDLSEEALKLTQNRGIEKKRLCCASVDKLPFKSECFDSVISMDVLCILDEKQEKSTLLEFIRVLKKEGILILNLPAFSWLEGEHDQAVSTKHRYIINDIKDKLESLQFKIIRSEYRYLLFLPVLFIVRLIRFKKKDKTRARSDLTVNCRIINFFFKIIVYLDEFIGNNISRPFGTSVSIVAQK